jgi:hypothetical protein
MESFVDVVERRSALRGERFAFAELDVRADVRARMSYRGLAERGRAIGGALAGLAPPAS